MGIRRSRTESRRAPLTGVLACLALLAAPAPAHAVLTVDAGGDLAAPAEDNQCLLREAVQFANANSPGNDDCGTPAAGADEINFAAAVTEVDLAVGNGTGAGEDANAAGDIDVTGTLTIRDTSGAVTIDGNDLDRVLDLPPGNNADLTLENLTVTNGTTDPDDANADGGGIRFSPVSGNLTLTNVDVTDSVARRASDAGRGGGVWASTPGTVTIQSGSTLSGNRGGGGAASEPGLGGGIGVSGTDTDLVVSNSTITDNDAGGGFASVGDSLGGGLFASLTGQANLTMTNATVTLNEAGGRNADADGLGGGIHLGSAGLDALITAGTISDNRAGGAGGGDGLGGGINAFPNLTDFDLNGVTLQGNQAGGQGAGGDGLGGGLHSESSVEIADSTFFQNRAGADGTAGVNGWGGAIRMDGLANPSLTMTNSLLQQNVAGTSAIGVGQGGGIYMEGSGAGTLDIEGGTLINNSALASSGASFPHGGGIYRIETDGAPVPTDTLTDVAVIANTAGGGSAGTGPAGGGLAFNTGGVLELTGTTVRSNTASAPAGASGLGGGILFQSALGSNSGSMQRGTLRLINSTVSTNTATSATAPLSGSGGGIFANQNSSVIGPLIEATSSTIANNIARNDSGFGQGGNLSFGGTFLTGSVDIQGSIITGGSGAAGAENCSITTADAVDSLGGSVEGPPSTTTQCQLDGANDLIGMDPLLQPLMDNGGPTETHAVPASSPAIDRVPALLCPPPATDQRGTARPQGAACDSGAYEFVPAPPPPPPPPVATPSLPATAPAPPATTKKCKKGQKLKKGKCVRKKRKKR